MGWYYARLSRDYYPLTGKCWEWLRMTRSWLGSNNPFASSSSTIIVPCLQSTILAREFPQLLVATESSTCTSPKLIMKPKDMVIPSPSRRILFIFYVFSRWNVGWPWNSDEPFAGDFPAPEMQQLIEKTGVSLGEYLIDGRVLSYTTGLHAWPYVYIYIYVYVRVYITYYIV